MTRTSFVYLVAGVGGVALMTAATAADTPRVVAAGGITDPVEFAYVWDGHGRGTRPVGVGLWTAEAGVFAPGFWAFDAGRPSDPPTGRPYTFAVRSADHADGFGPPEGDAARRAGYVRELLGRFYPNGGWTADPTAARAAQVAVWEITSEDRLPVASADRFGLFGGTFRADYPTPEAAPDFVRRAQSFLAELTGDDRPFRQHPAFSRSELVQLAAEPEPDVVRYHRVGSVMVARPYDPCNPCIPCSPCGATASVWERTVSPGARGPSLFAVRPADVPAVGGGGAAGPTGAGFAPGGLGGGFGALPAAGYGGFGGGPGGFGGGVGSPGVGGEFVPVSPGDSLTTPTGGLVGVAPIRPTAPQPGVFAPNPALPGLPVPPLGGPTVHPPANPDGGPTLSAGPVAVPAPAALFLGLLGAGSVGGWAVVCRLRKKNEQ